jgi:hypothetical protein
MRDWLERYIAVYFFCTYCITLHERHGKPIHWHLFSSMKPQIEDIQGNSPQGQTSPFTWTDIFRVYCAQQNKQIVLWEVEYRSAHARLPRYGSFASLSSVVTNIRPRGDWKQRGASGTTLIRRQTPLIVISFGLNFRYDLSRKCAYSKNGFSPGSGVSM